MTADDITLEYQDSAVTIRFLGVVHFKFRAKDLISIQAWMNGVDKKIYSIEYRFKDCATRCEYDVEFKWKKILELLDRASIFSPEDFE